MCLSLSQTQDLFSFFPNTLMRIFENEIIPVLQMMTQNQGKNSHLDYHIGVRMMKLSILIINNLGIGVNLINLVLSEAEGIFAKQNKES